MRIEVFPPVISTVVESIRMMSPTWLGTMLLKELITARHCFLTHPMTGTYSIRSSDDIMSRAENIPPILTTDDDNFGIALSLDPSHYNVSVVSTDHRLCLVREVVLLIHVSGSQCYWQ